MHTKLQTASGNEARWCIHVAGAPFVFYPAYFQQWRYGGSCMQLRRHKQREYLFFALLALFVLVPGVPHLQAQGLSFTDVPAGYWAADEITRLAEAGVVNGRASGIFAPDDPVQRAELIKMIVADFEAEGLDLPTAGQEAGQNCGNFADVRPAAWYYSYVQQACQSDIARGYGSTFGPAAPVTREQAVTMLMRAFRMAIKAPAQAPALPSGFADAASISAWAREAVATAVALDLVSGYQDHTLRPGAVLSRAEAAVLLVRFSDRATQQAAQNATGQGTDPAGTGTDTGTGTGTGSTGTDTGTGTGLGGNPGTGNGTGTDTGTGTGTGTGIVQVPTQPVALAVLGYATVDYPGDTGSLQSIQNHGQQLAFIANFTYQVTADGMLLGRPSSALVAAAQAAGVKPLAVVSNYVNDIGTFSTSLIHTLLNSPAQQVILINNIKNALEQNGYAGVNIDFENVPATDRNALTAFMRNLAQALRPQYLVTIALPAKTYENPADNWSGAFDYAAIGEACDFVDIMTYDEHWLVGPPGPIASYDWVEQVIDYAEKAIPPQKIMLGIGAYGYDWTTGVRRGQLVRQVDIPTLLKAHGGQLQWSDDARESYYTYTAGGSRHQVWVEDDKATAERIALAQGRGLFGIAIWRLGHEDEGFWSVIAPRP